MLADHLQKAKKEYKNLKKQENQDVNELYKACSQRYMAYGHFKDLTRRTVSDKLLREKIFSVAKIQNMMDIKGVLFQWFLNFLIKNLLCLFGQRP